MLDLINSCCRFTSSFIHNQSAQHLPLLHGFIVKSLTCLAGTRIRDLMQTSLAVVP